MPIFANCLSGGCGCLSEEIRQGINVTLHSEPCPYAKIAFLGVETGHGTRIEDLSSVG